MEVWIVLCLTFAALLLIKAANAILAPSSRPTLPPRPFSFPLIGNIQLLKTSVFDLEPFLRSVCSKLGPFVSLSLGNLRLIIIADGSLAHEALIQNSVVFASRPSASLTDIMTSSNQHNINSSFYGPNWRAFRRNLTSWILQYSRQNLNSSTGKRVITVLDKELRQYSGSPVQVVDHFRRAMFLVLGHMCFGEEIDDRTLIEVQRTTDRLAHNCYSYSFLNILPKLNRILFRRKLEEFQKMVVENEKTVIPIIHSRKKISEAENMNPCYADTLLSLNLPEEKRKLSDGEMVSLCFEFLVASVDTTTTTLQWIFANLVKHRRVQEKLYKELEEVLGKKVCEDGEEEMVIQDAQLGKTKYLKAVVLEALRLHPPGHLVLSHAVSEDVVLRGHLVPKNGIVNFLVAEIGRDPKVWEEPMEFRPERFMQSGMEFDITCTKEIKMMPFGAGRRMCPGYTFALQHLEYLVANLVWRFEWKEVAAVGVDLSVSRGFTFSMKNPLQVNCMPRNIIKVCRDHL